MAKMKQVLLDIAESQENGEEDGFVFPVIHPATTQSVEDETIPSVSLLRVMVILNILFRMKPSNGSTPKKTCLSTLIRGGKILLTPSYLKSNVLNWKRRPPSR